MVKRWAEQCNACVCIVVFVFASDRPLVSWRPSPVLPFFIVVISYRERRGTQMGHTTGFPEPLVASDRS